MSASIERNHRADIAVEIRKFAEHRGPSIEVVAIENAALGGAMRGDYRYAAFERKPEQPRISHSLVDHRHGVFAAGVRKQWKPRLRHSLPKRFVTSIAEIDVLAIRQAFH